MSRTKEKLLKKQAQRDAEMKGQEERGDAIRVPSPVIQYIKKEKRDATPNRKSEFKTVEEEADARQAAVETQVLVFRRMLPTILKGISNIKDPRRKGSVRHKMRVLVLYGILMFVHQIASRRKVNDKMSKPEFVESMKTIFPEIESIPHADTLADLLEDMEVDRLEDITVSLVRELMRSKKFIRSLQDRRYIVAMDGSGKYSRDWQFSMECLHRKKPDGSEKYFVYVLEAALILGNGMSLPFMSEFLDNGEYDFSDKDKKQDCELKAFKRLAERLKKNFPGTRFALVLDGLYPNGPVFTICRRNKWDYMITLKDGSLKEIWANALGLRKLETENVKKQIYGDRVQEFWWANDMEHVFEYTNDKGKKVYMMEKVNLVVCNESWTEHTREGDIVKKVKFAWVSGRRITAENVHRRCNLIGRYRWFIENNVFQTEKCRGYHYQHSYSYNWQAMKGFHHLMHIAHILNNLVLNTEYLWEYVKKYGFGNVLEFLYETWIGRWIDGEKVGKLIEEDNWQLRFVF
mgnify:CR=1 FL=1